MWQHRHTLDMTVCEMGTGLFFKRCAAVGVASILTTNIACAGLREFVVADRQLDHSINGGDAVLDLSRDGRAVASPIKRASAAELITYRNMSFDGRMDVIRGASRSINKRMMSEFLTHTVRARKSSSTYPDYDFAAVIEAYNRMQPGLGDALIRNLVGRDLVRPAKNTLPYGYRQRVYIITPEARDLMASIPMTKPIYLRDSDVAASVSRLKRGYARNPSRLT